MCSTNIMVVNREYGAMSVQQFVYLVPLLVGEFVLKIRHHLFDHVAFCFFSVNPANDGGLYGFGFVHLS